MEDRKDIYNRRVKEISQKCKSCRSGKFPPSPERCEECSVGRRLRWLETEYSDVTGWGHAKW